MNNKWAVRLIAGLFCSVFSAIPFSTFGSDILRFGNPGSFAAETGKGSFVFGVATAPSQIEEQPQGMPLTDFAKWAMPPPEGLGLAENPIGEGVLGLQKFEEDLERLKLLKVDVYRLGVEWGRIEPYRDMINYEAVERYREILEKLVNAGIKPVLTIHHFTSPLWISDPADPEGNHANQLGGLDDEEDRTIIVEEFAEHAAFLAAEFGHLVDDYATFNEPAVALLANQYLFGTWPPNISDLNCFMSAFRTMADAHAAMYDALKANDNHDADGDGWNATVGITIATGDYVPVDPNNPIHRFTAESFGRLSQTDVVRFFIEGFFDTNLNTIKDPGEEVPDYLNPDGSRKIDWMGVQHYFRMSIRPETTLGLPLDLLIPDPGMICLDACPEPAHPTFYDAWNRHIFALDTKPVTEKPEFKTLLRILRRIDLQVPNLPIIITENGLYTNNPVRRAQLLIRTLEQVQRAIQEGIDVRGYIHWSLMDNWEWGSYTPKFGLYQIDRSSPNYDRITNIAVRTYSNITRTRSITDSKILAYIRTGPLANEFSDVSGYVWYDLNRNGIRDHREPGVEGLAVRLYFKDGTLMMTNSIASSIDVELGLVPQELLKLFDQPLETITDTNGYFIFDGRRPGDFAVGLYAFDGLSKGEYLVQFEIPDGYQFTIPDRWPDSRDSDVIPNTVIGEAAPIHIKIQGKNLSTVGAGLVEYVQDKTGH